jgi:ABC-type nitrate/sulfonate/bicarbonate transport system substrate-binding protein
MTTHALPRRAALKAGLAASLLPALARPGYAQTRTVKFTLPWLAQGSTLFTYVGRQQGIFRSRGIDIEISRGFGSLAAAQAIAGGQFDYGTVIATPLILSIARGLPLTGLATLDYDATMGVGVLADSPITSPAMLAGKKVAGVPTSAEFPFFPPYLRKAGVDPAAVEIVQVDNRVLERTLSEKQVDAMMGVGSSSLPVLLSRNVAVRWMLYSGVGLRTYGNIVTAKPETVAKDPGIAQAMVDGLAEAEAFTLKKPQESIEIFMKEVPEMALNAGAKEFLRIGLGLWHLSIIKPEAKEHGIGWGDPAVFGQMIDLVMSSIQGPNMTKPTVEAVYSNRFAGKVKLTAAEWEAAAANVSSFARMMA